MARIELSAARILPEDAAKACLIGRAWLPGVVPGPSPIAVDQTRAYDLSGVAPTCADLINLDSPVRAVKDVLASGRAKRIGSVEELIANSLSDKRDPARPYLLAPPDLQALKACGVTFVSSMLERVIEEQAKGDPQLAESARANVGAEIGASLASVKPGSAEAARVKEFLVKRGLWSQYLEVGIGPDAEVFTKSQPMAAVGAGAEVGIHPASQWNNPEPEIVMAVNNRGQIVGATLGNDVNLRDFEGRSALLLGRGKDNNGSCAIGPFIRLFDQHFSLNNVREATIHIEVSGDDGFKLEGLSEIAKISRDIADLVQQTINDNHQYPDGLMLFLGTMFAPIQDRGEAGQGFTHKIGDIVTIRSPQLGTLVNRVNYTHQIPRWEFGTSQLMRNLTARGLL
jgi:fumarylacetoacetate (FAA) hydrolase family protein